MSEHGKDKKSFKDIDWKAVVSRYSHAKQWLANGQIVNTLVPYVIVWLMMVWSLRVSYGLTLALAVVAAGLVVRLFIIFHDCGHGSFYRSRRANTVWGYIFGVLTFTACDLWWHEHAIHHATAGNLDRRGVGDIWTLTAQEYLRGSLWLRLRYRLVRNPVCLFLIGAPVMFLIVNRFPSKGAGKKQRKSVHWTNFGILVLALTLIGVMGLKSYFLIQLPIIIIAASAGIWLFYMQHQFKDTYWRRTPEWDFVEMALLGSTYYRLPKILQWFTGNIGFHHIHHLGPRIPNYLLERCYRENSLFQEGERLTIRTSLKSLSLRVWDEQNRELISFPEMRKRVSSRLITV